MNSTFNNIDKSLVLSLFIIVVNFPNSPKVRYVDNNPLPVFWGKDMEIQRRQAAQPVYITQSEPRSLSLETVFSSTNLIYPQIQTLFNN